MNRRILCVDDEPQILNGLRRTLSDGFEITVATSGAEALRFLESEPVFAVVMSDMRMPGMDGAALLSKVHTGWPDTTRVLLTGYTDVNVAISAVNDGQIFRFLVKPCPEAELKKSLTAATEQYRLITAERELLELTLGGALGALMEVLGVVAPELVARSARLERLVEGIAAHLDESSAWIYKTAARLSQLGLIALPKEIVDRVVAGVGVSERDRKLFESYPEVSGRILQSIPRLEMVAEIVRHQLAATAPSFDDRRVARGVSVLRAAVAVDALMVHGRSLREAVEAVTRQKGLDSEVMVALEKSAQSAAPPPRQLEQVSVGVQGLRVGMIPVDNVCSSAGAVVVPAGKAITGLILERLHKFSQGVGLVEPIRVLVPEAQMSHEIGGSR